MLHKVLGLIYITPTLLILLYGAFDEAKTSTPGKMIFIFSFVIALFITFAYGFYYLFFA